MQQIYLTGKYADDMAARALTALRVKAAGYRLLPLEVDGCVRGRAMHLLTVPDAPLYNDVPCKVCISPRECIILGEVYERVAAPALRQAAAVQAVVLIGGVCKAALAESGFEAALRACLCGRALALTVVDEDAADAVRAMTSAEDQLWLHAAIDNDELMNRLLQEISMRI